MSADRIPILSKLMLDAQNDTRPGGLSVTQALVNITPETQKKLTKQILILKTKTPDVKYYGITLSKSILKEWKLDTQVTTKDGEPCGDIVAYVDNNNTVRYFYPLKTSASETVIVAGQEATIYKTAKPGEGNFGKVKIVVDPSTNALWVEKIVKGNIRSLDRDKDEEKNSLAHELEIVQAVYRAEDVPPVIFEKLKSEKDNNKTYNFRILLPFENGPKLSDAIEHNYSQCISDIDHLIATMQKMSQALTAFHALGFWHCDIKLDNFILREDGDIKLIDFGLSRGKDESYGIGGTQGYLPPELYAHMGKDNVKPMMQFHEATEVYALGVCFKIMLLNYLNLKITQNNVSTLNLDHSVLSSNKTTSVSTSLTAWLKSYVPQQGDKKTDDEKTDLDIALGTLNANKDKLSQVDQWPEAAQLKTLVTLIDSMLTYTYHSQKQDPLVVQSTSTEQKQISINRQEPELTSVVPLGQGNIALNKVNDTLTNLKPAMTQAILPREAKNEANNGTFTLSYLRDEMCATQFKGNQNRLNDRVFVIKSELQKTMLKLLNDKITSFKQKKENLESKVRDHIVDILKSADKTENKENDETLFKFIVKSVNLAHPKASPEWVHLIIAREALSLCSVFKRPLPSLKPNERKPDKNPNDDVNDVNKSDLDKSVGTVVDWCPLTYETTSKLLSAAAAATKQNKSIHWYNKVFKSDSPSCHEALQQCLDLFASLSPNQRKNLELNA